MSSPLASRNGHRTERHLLSVEGEEVIDLVEKHPVAYVPAGLWITGGLVSSSGAHVGRIRDHEYARF